MPVITKTIDDACEVGDDDTRPGTEFCLIAHVHFKADSVESAIKMLADHFTAVYEGRESDTFSAGHVLLRQAHEVHIEAGETRH